MSVNLQTSNTHASMHFFVVCATEFSWVDFLCLKTSWNRKREKMDVKKLKRFACRGADGLDFQDPDTYFFRTTLKNGQIEFHQVVADYSWAGSRCWTKLQSSDTSSILWRNGKRGSLWKISCFLFTYALARSHLQRLLTVLEILCRSDSMK